MIKLVILLMLVPQQSGNLLDAVTNERGGRHWIDQKPDPPKSPAKSQACFQIEPGSRIELVASEPLVFDPVWIDFDHLGRMFVAEYVDYPIGPVNDDGTEKKDAAPLSRIVLLEDTDADGRMDKRTVFADQLQFCHSFMPLKDGILAGAQSEILFLKDTDGDNVADVREVWFDGFLPAHPQMQIGCPRWGLDNWIYLTYAPGNVKCHRPGYETKEAVKLPRQDMRFDPFTMKFEAISGLGQFGNTIDNDGNRFFCTNRNPIMMELIPETVARRNPFATISKRHTDVGPSGGDTKVFPMVDMKSNYLSHAGTHTSACGVSAYRGNLWNTEFQHSVFACEPVGHLVTRSIVEPQMDSPALTARRARPDADFLASNDTWFRPASLRTGPDGAIYLADMYRMWVEHPRFLPPEIAARIDWRAGEDRGRVWRILPAESKLTGDFKTPQTADACVAMLKDANGWRRQMAHRLLAEKFAAAPALPKTVAALRALVRDQNVLSETRHHALNVLVSANRLEPQDVAKSLNDASPIVRKAALRLATTLPKQTLRIQEASNLLLQDSDPRVQLTALLTASSLPTDETHLLRLADSTVWADQWIQSAALSAAGDSATPLISILAARSKLRTGGSHVTLLNRLASAVAAKGDVDEIASLLEMARNPETLQEDVTAIVEGFDNGAKRNKGPVAYKSLSSLLDSPPESMTETADQVQKRILKIVSSMENSDSSIEDKVAAMRLFAAVKRADFGEQVSSLLEPGQPQQIQQATLRIIREFGMTDALPKVLSGFRQLGPLARRDAAELMLIRTNTTTDLLEGMQAGKISPAIVDIDRRIRLLQHRDKKIRSLAEEVFGGVVSANRKAVADKYLPAVSMKASAEKGAALFKKTCNKCHKINGEGHNVGPDISDTRNRSRDALLYDILDPNRRVDPQFGEYVVITTDGRTLNGLLISDSAGQIVLRQPEGKDVTVPRDEVEELQATNKSLMPEGIEKDVSVEQMAHLLEFLKAR